MDYRGFVQLPAGATAQQTVTQYFLGQTAQGKTTADLRGPVNKDYLIRDSAPIASMVWMPCGRVAPLNLNAQARFVGKVKGAAQLTMDSHDGKVRIVLGLQYRRC